MTAGAPSPLRYRPFRFLVAGRTVVTLGNAVAPVALAFAVLDLTGSVRDLGLVVGARSLTNVLFLLAGGVIADRFPRHLVMVAASAFAALTQALVAAVVLTGAGSIPLLAGLAAVNGAVAAVALPAASALVPQTVPPEIRQPANAINRLCFNTAMIIGAAAGGALVAAVGPGWGLAVDAVAFALAGACFALVRVPDIRDPDGPRSRVLADLRQGWQEFTSHTWLWVVVVGFMFLNAVHAAAIGVLGPAVADATIGRAGWGLVLAAETAGMVAGAVVAMRLRVRRLLRWGVACMAAEVTLVLALAVTPRFGFLIAAAVLTGFAVEQFAVAWDTTMQQQIPADRLARVYSYDMLGSFLAIPAGQMVAGPVAVAIGADAALLAGAGVIGLSVAGMLVSRDVRRLEHSPPAPPSPAPKATAPAGPPVPPPPA